MHLVPKTALGETIPVASTRPIALESYCTRKSVLRNKSSRPALPPNRALDVLFPIIIDSFTYSPIDFLNTRLVCSFDSTLRLLPFVSFRFSFFFFLCCFLPSTRDRIISANEDNFYSIDFVIPPAHLSPRLYLPGSYSVQIHQFFHRKRCRILWYSSSAEF